MIGSQVLGHSGLRVSSLCLGAGTFGHEEWGASEKESEAIFRHYRSTGGSFIDTANKYAAGRSEEIVGRLAHHERDELVIATKFTAAHGPGGEHNLNAYGNQRKNLRLTLDRSLSRLDVDYIDVLWVHAWDPATSLFELMRALDDQVRQGKVLHLGASNTPAWVVASANAIAERYGLAPFSAVQVEYSLIERGAEREIIPMAQNHGLSFLGWAPLAWGLLTGKYMDEAQPTSRRFTGIHPRLNSRSESIITEVLRVSREVGASPAQVAIAWIRAQAFGPIPVIGARSVRQIEDNLAALAIELSSEQLDQLDQVSRVHLGVPTEFLQSEGGVEFFLKPDTGS